MFDSLYSRYGPMRNAGDRSAGQVRAPFSFMSRCMGLCFRGLMIYAGGQNGVGADGKVVCKLVEEVLFAEKMSLACAFGHSGEKSVGVVPPDDVRRTRSPGGLDVGQRAVASGRAADAGSDRHAPHPGAGARRARGAKGEP